MHRNARLTPEGRRILCERIASGRPTAHVDGSVPDNGLPVVEPVSDGGRGRVV